MHDIQAICPRALLFCIWFLVVKCMVFSNFRRLGHLGAIIVLALCGSICLLNVSISKCVVGLDHSKELCEDCIWNKEWSLNEAPDAFRISVHRFYCGTLKSFLLASLDVTCYRTHWRICVSLCGAHRPAISSLSPVILTRDSTLTESCLKCIGRCGWTGFLNTKWNYYEQKSWKLQRDTIKGVLTVTHDQWSHMEQSRFPTQQLKRSQALPSHMAFHLPLKKPQKETL